jgi:hypothetical protein
MGCMKQRHDDPHGHSNLHDHRNEYMDTSHSRSQSPFFQQLMPIPYACTLLIKMFLRNNSATPILACPALVSAGCQRAMQACAAMNFFGKFPGKRMGMLDSGCNELIIKLDDESRAFACD